MKEVEVLVVNMNDLTAREENPCSLKFSQPREPKHLSVKGKQSN